MYAALLYLLLRISVEDNFQTNPVRVFSLLRIRRVAGEKSVVAFTFYYYLVNFYLALLPRDCIRGPSLTPWSHQFCEVS